MRKNKYKLCSYQRAAASFMLADANCCTSLSVIWTYTPPRVWSRDLGQGLGRLGTNPGVATIGRHEFA